MYRIGEFSQLGQISVRMLRHYDKLDLLKPSYVDYETGYRFYIATQLPKLHKIIALNGLGIPLAKIQQIIKNDAYALEDIRALLQEQKSKVETEMSQQRIKLANIESRLKLLENETSMPYEIVTRHVPSTRLFVVSSIVPSLQEMANYCKKMYELLYEQLRIAGTRSHGIEFTLYQSQEFAENDIEMMVGVVADQNIACPESLTNLQLPAEANVASLIYRGPYSGLTDPILFLLNWLSINFYHPKPPLRELHLSGKAHNDAGQADHDAVIELQLPFTS